MGTLTLRYPGLLAADGDHVLPSYLSNFNRSAPHKHRFCAPACNHTNNFGMILSNARLLYLAEASRRISNYPRVDNLFDDHRDRRVRFEDDDDDDDDEEDDRSLDLLVQFLQNVFKKLSRRVKKAVRSVLPPTISSQLVAFSVNGVLILAFLWIAKAFLQVMCTIGSAVFIVILLLRIVWSAIAYLRISRKPGSLHGFDDDGSWNRAQPAT
eukprot:TRINITY_DN40425_c0_g1_i1.p1 TRINITY_DN40425_c0_g1~~TRINITY_DN40425_c0_g1_i1.p1  ORF type:complete len:211 (+),score=16.11 TRINITY_DN40425_c0_g1_i1:113-745(+)